MSTSHPDLDAARLLAVSPYDREALLAHVAAVLPRYQWNPDGARRVRRVAALTADVLDGLPGECLQDRWDAFESSVWPGWVAGRERLPVGVYWTWGAWMLVISRLARPSLTMSGMRLNQWAERLPADDPLWTARAIFTKTAESLEWGTSWFKNLALRSGLHLLLSRGYDSWGQLGEADPAALPLGCQGADLIDAVLSRLGVIERGPLRGSTRRLRVERLSPSQLAETADIPAWAKPVTALYLETYATRLSDRYATLRHKTGAMVHFWRYLELQHPEIAACRDVTPAAARGFVEYVLSRARETSRQSDGDVSTSAHAFLVNARTFFADICTWATEEDSPFAEHAPAVVPLTRLDFLDAGFRRARLRRDARMTATVLDLEREMPNIRAFALRRWHEAEQALAARPGDRTALAAETTAFWDWALVELLVTSGLRVEEVCELTTFDVLRRQLLDGKIYYLLHVKPSKLGGARTIPIGDGLGRVIAEIVRHVRRFYATDHVPACDRRDDHELRPLPRAPYLLQGAGHPSAMGTNTIRHRLRKLSSAVGARHSDGSPLVLRPHDCRRVFASEHLNNNTPVQVIQSLLAHPPDPPEQVFARLAAPGGLCADASVFTRADVIAALVDMDIADSSGRGGPLLLPADSIENLADDFLASDLVVELLADQDATIKSIGDQPAFTTIEILGVQARILDRFRAGRSVGLAVAPDADLAEGLSGHLKLTSEQRDLVVAFCTSGHRAQCAIGRGGAGKTTAMRAAAAAWTAAGFRVVGTAVKGEAAHHLGQEAGVPTETLAWHLAHTDPGTSPLDARTVLIVDEASTLSDRDLDRLLWLAEATGAAVRLIGDPAQHGAVGAGGMFRVLCEDSDGHTPELRHSHRVLDPHDRAAADALRDGRIADALGELEAAGHLHVVTDEVDLYLDLLDRWWRSRQAGEDHPMVDRRNRTRFQLNRLAHLLLQVTGEIGADEVVAAQDRRFSVGDQVVARKGDRTLYPQGRPQDYVRNGARGTVVGIRTHRKPERDSIRVTFDSLGEMDLPREFFEEHSHPGGRTDVGLDHAYAVTSYGVQGATFTESTSRIDENASRSEAYVDITRGRLANHLYLTRSADPLDGERLPKAPPPPLAATVGRRLSASGPERAAVDVDPVAPEAATTRTGRSLADLQAATLDADDPGPAVSAATELRARQVARTAARSLDPAVLDRLPPRSHIPYLARQWDATVADLSVFLARWEVTPGGPGRWDWALGPRPDTPGQEQDRRQMASQLADLSVAAASEAVRSRGGELPGWARAHLAHHTAQGNCCHDPQDLMALYARIEAYRRAAGIAEADHNSAEEAIFGPTPEDSTLRMRRHPLVEEALSRDAAIAHTRAARATA